LIEIAYVDMPKQYSLYGYTEMRLFDDDILGSILYKIYLMERNISRILKIGKKINLYTT